MLRKVFIDIETKDERDGVRYFADPSVADEPVLSVTIYYNYNDLFVTFSWRNGAKERRKSDSWWIYVFQNEEEMLKAVVKWLEKFGPDLLIGFNHKSYDLPYFLNRCDEYKINYKYISPYGTFFKSKDGEVVAKGVILFDIMEAYKKVQRNKIRKYSLAYIAEREGFKKIEFEGSIYKLWKMNFRKLLEYNKHDVKLLVDLDEKLGLVNHFDSISKLAGCSIEDAFWNSAVAEKMFLRNGKFILNNKPPRDAPEVEWFKGAFVKRPEKGVHKNVIVLDFKALYPSIIISVNISPETYVPPDKRDEFDQEQLVVLPNGVAFKKEPKGLLPEMLERLFALRQNYKNKMKKAEHGSKEWKHWDNMQFITKSLINSFYGYLTYKRSRILNYELGSSIPDMGQRAIQFVASLLESWGRKVLYADTDSIFVVGRGEEYPDLKKDAIELMKEINLAFGEFPKTYNGTNTFYMDFKHIDKSVFWGDAKKRYAEIRYREDENGDVSTEMVITGMEFVRSDWSEETAKVQQHVFKQVLEGMPKEAIFEYVREEKKRLRELPIHEVFPTRSITKAFEDYKVKSNHIKAAEWSNEMAGTRFKPGDKGYLVWVTSTAPLPSPKKNNDKTRCILWDRDEVPPWMKIDWKTTEEKIIDAPLRSIFEVLGWRNMKMKPLTEFL